MAGNDKNKNPWGQQQGGGNDDRGRSPWGSGGGSGGGSGQEPPDLDDLLRRAHDNFNSVMSGGSGSYKMIAIVVLAVFALWMASGLYVVNPGENAVIQRFGAWSRTQAEPGLGYHFPAPFEKATIVNVEEIRVMTIGFAEGYSRNGAVAKQDMPDESLMLTSDRNIVDLDLAIQWNIKSSEDFLFKIQDQENTIKQVAQSAIREVVGQTDMFKIITTGRAAIADQTREIVQRNLDEYNSGVNIKQILIQNAEVHPDVQDAFQDVQSAKQDAEDVQNRADAYREDILPKARGRAIQMLQEAEGYRQSAVARAKGDADRFNSVYEAYLNGKDVTKERIYIETMESVLRNAQTIIMDGKSSQGVVPYLPLNDLRPSQPKAAE